MPTRINLYQIRSMIACLLIAALVEITASSSTSFAQTTYGAIDGKVLDSQGRPATATVIISNQSTGAEQTATTSTNGNYSFPFVVPGIYTITVKIFTGLSKTRRVVVGQVATEEFIIPADPNPNTTGTVPPTSTTPAASDEGQDSISMDIRSARVGVNFIRRDIERSPDKGQQLPRLLLQVPGANEAGSSAFGGVTFNGQPSSQNVTRVDGVDFTPLVNLSQPDEEAPNIPSIRSDQSLFNIQEFRVDSSNYPASLGTGTGGQISAITKSGDAGYRFKLYEFLRDDALNARNFFDFISEPPFKFNLFGGQFSGPLCKGKHSFSFNYEGIKARLGSNIFEAVPSTSARARAVRSALPLLDSFLAPGGSIIPGASTSPDFDIVRLASKTISDKNAFDLRIDLFRQSQSPITVRYTHSRLNEDSPEGVTGRRQLFEDFTRNALASWQLKSAKKKLVNEAKFGVNAPFSHVAARPRLVDGADLSQVAISIGGNAPYSGTPNIAPPLSIATSGGLLRQNAIFSGRRLSFDPTVFSIVDDLILDRDSHTLSFGGEVRLLRIGISRLNGSTYTYGSLADLLQNKVQSIQFLGDLGAPSPFNSGPAGERKANQEYYIAYALDQWKLRENLTLTYGIRYEYYWVLREEQNRAVLFDINSGVLLPPDTPFYKSPKTNFLPRVGIAWAPINRNPAEMNKNPFVLRANFGIYSGPKRLQDQTQPIESDRINFTQAGGTFPVPAETLIAGFRANPDTRRFQPSAFSRDYNIVDRTYKYDVSIDRNIIQGESKALKLTATYSGSQSRNLLLQNFANRIVRVQTNPDPTRSAAVIREFDIVRGATVLTPFAEIDFRSSAGSSSYNSLQLSAEGNWKSTQSPWGSLQLIKTQYTLSRNFGNVNSAERSVTTGNPFDPDYELGYNAEDARHVFSFSTQYLPPVGRSRRYLSNLTGIGQSLLGNWTISTLIYARSGLPIDVRIARPDIVYVDASNNIYSSPGPGREAVINTPGGGASRNVRRPDLIPGANPYLRNGRAYLNPTAFAIPEPGSFGNLKRGFLRGPNLKQFDLSFTKEFTGEKHTIEFRVDFLNVFNITNFSNPLARLPNAVGTDVTQNQLQPGQPFNAESAGTFGLLNRTTGNKDSFNLLNSSRQIQFGISVNLNKN